MFRPDVTGHLQGDLLMTQAVLVVCNCTEFYFPSDWRPRVDRWMCMHGVVESTVTVLVGVLCWNTLHPHSLWHSWLALM